MSWLIIKYFIATAMVVLVSEVAKLSDKIGGLIAAFPIVSVLSLMWLYVENQPQSKIANHALYTFWNVIPTLPMFLVFPFLLSRLGFCSALLVSTVITLSVFYIFAFIGRRFGIELF